MLDDSDKRMIIRLLFTAFHRDTVFEKWINNASIPYGLWAQGWLADDNLSQCVRDWFANEAITDHGFTSDEISQAQAAAKSTAALFEPMALFCAREWIGPDATGYNLEVYVWFLHVFMGLVSASLSYLPISALKYALSSRDSLLLDSNPNPITKSGYPAVPPY